MNPDRPPMSAEQIEEAALALPEVELELLVERLSAHLDSAGVDDAWLREARRRSQEIALGEVEPVPVEATLAKLRAMLR
jgi:hypothetical protein